MKRADPERHVFVARRLAGGFRQADVARELRLTRGAFNGWLRENLPHLTKRHNSTPQKVRAKSYLTKIGHTETPAKSCRYYIAQTMTECGEHIDGGQYCDKHLAATTPKGTEHRAQSTEHRGDDHANR